METSDIQARILETKNLIRRVRTPAGARRFGQPIGSIIVRDPIPTFTRRRKRRAASQTRQNDPDVSMVQNAPHERSVDVRASAVAPSPDLPQVSEDDAVPMVPNLRMASFQSPRVQLYTNDAPMRDQLDLDYLSNATSKQAAQDLIEMGVNLRLSREFLHDRDFMVSLAESVRIHEEMFPGFIYRHGNFYAGRRGMGGKKGVIAYNKTIARYDAEDDTIDAMKPGDHAYGTISGHDLSGNMRNPFAMDDLSLNPAPEMSQSITVFLDAVIDSADRSVSSGHAATPNGDLGFFAANDWWTDMSEAVGGRQAAMVYLMTHEFGHAINNTVSGNMSFEIDGWEDPDQYKRRWYAEYYNNAQLDLFESMGVFKRTGKKYKADHLKAEADHYKNVILPSEAYLDQYKGYKQELRDWVTQDAYGEAPSFHEFFTEAMSRYDLPVAVVEYLRSAERNADTRGVIWELTSTMPKAPSGDDSFAMVVKNRAVSSESLEGMFSLFQGMAPTFDQWEKNGYITGVNLEAWNDLVSGYASKKVVEFEAESWASYMLDRQTTEATQRWGNMVHDMYTWWVQDDMDPEFGQNNDEE